MNYAAFVGDTEREVEITEVAPYKYRISIDKRVVEVDARVLSDNTVSLLCDGDAYNIEWEEHPDGGGNLLVRGHVVHVELLDLRRLRLRQAQARAGGPAGPTKVASPMPGKVVAVLVQEGDMVTEGQGLVVVEAMKMENELRAPREGVVEGLAVNEGDAVEGGATLCVVS